MDNRQNPFVEPTPEELLKRENEKKELEIRIKSVAELAAQCLDDPKFKKYREDFEKLRKDAFKLLRDPLETDPIKDAYYLRAVINTINVLDMLLNKPVEDAKKKV